MKERRGKREMVGTKTLPTTSSTADHDPSCERELTKDILIQFIQTHSDSFCLMQTNKQINDY